MPILCATCFNFKEVKRMITWNEIKNFFWVRYRTINHNSHFRVAKFCKVPWKLSIMKRYDSYCLLGSERFSLLTHWEGISFFCERYKDFFFSFTPPPNISCSESSRFNPRITTQFIKDWYFCDLKILSLFLLFTVLPLSVRGGGFLG